MLRPTAAKTVTQYLAAIDEPRKSQVRKLHDAIRKAVPQLEPSIQNDMIGYGTYHYRYATGREGDCPIIALASNKSSISVYVSAAVDGEYVAEKNRALLPKAKIGKSCIRFNKLEDIDLGALGRIVKEGARAMKPTAPRRA
jgi:hypothetical protein